MDLPLFLSLPRAQGLFSGPGRVVFTSAVTEVHPGWFSERLGGLAGSALQRAADACPAAGCTLLISRAVGIESTVGLNPRNGAFSTAAATIYAAGHTPGAPYRVDALALRPGKYLRPIHLGSIISMRTCLTVMVRAPRGRGCRGRLRGGVRGSCAHGFPCSSWCVLSLRPSGAAKEQPRDINTTRRPPLVAGRRAGGQPLYRGDAGVD